MSSNYSGRTTPHSDVDHPHRITYSPFNEEEDPQPVPMLPPRPPTPGPIALENRGTQTSPKPCPIHQQHVAITTIHTPPFARQIQQPPTLQEALELRELLRNPDLQTPIVTHCELHSLMFTLHRTYRNLIADENQHPNEKQRKTLEANIIESLHQIDALPFLRDLKQIPERHRRKNLLHQLLSTRSLEERLPILPMSPLPPTPAPPRGTSMPPQITWALRPTQNAHKTRITLTTTPPRSNPLSERIQNQETRVPPHITHHILLLLRKNHQKQGKGEEETSYPRAKKDRKRHRQGFRRHRKRMGQKDGGILPKPKRTPRIRRRSPRKHQRRAIWILDPHGNFGP